MILERNARLTHAFHHYFAFLQHSEEHQDPVHLQETIEILEGLLDRNHTEANCLELHLSIDKTRRELPVMQDAAPLLYRPQKYLSAQGIPDSENLGVVPFTLYQASRVDSRPDMRPYGLQFVQYTLQGVGIDIYCAVDVGLAVPHVLCFYLGEIQDISFGRTAKEHFTKRIMVRQKK